MDYLTRDVRQKSATTAYIFTLSLVFFILPAVIIFICYTIILNAFKRSSNRLQRIDCDLQSSCNSSSGRANNNQQNQLDYNNHTDYCDSPGNNSSNSSRSRFAQLGESIRYKMSLRIRQQVLHQARLSMSDQINYSDSMTAIGMNARRLSDTMMAKSAPTGLSNIYNIEQDSMNHNCPSPSNVVPNYSHKFTERFPIEQRRLAFKKFLTQSAIQGSSCNRLGENSSHRNEQRYQQPAIQMRLIPGKSSSIIYTQNKRQIELNERKSKQRTPESLCTCETSAMPSGDRFTFRLRSTNVREQVSTSKQMAQFNWARISFRGATSAAESPSCSLSKTRQPQKQPNKHPSNSIIKQSFSAALLKVSRKARKDCAANEGLDFQNSDANQHHSSIIRQANAAIHQPYSRTDLQMRLAMMSFYLILLWLISWAPLGFLTLINSLNTDCEKFSSLAIFLASTMTKVGPTFDVFIYGISHPKIKVRYRQIMKRLMLAGPLACKTIYLIALKSFQRMFNSFTKSDTSSCSDG